MLSLATVGKTLQGAKKSYTYGTGGKSVVPASKTSLELPRKTKPGIVVLNSVRGNQFNNNYE